VVAVLAMAVVVNTCCFIVWINRLSTSIG
jgi:hypothetical protein